MIRSSKPIPRRRDKPRRGPFRDEKYLAYLREECACYVCKEVNCIRHGYAGGCAYCALQSVGHCDPAHGPPAGRGQKGPDNEAIPLCRGHHEYQTQIGILRFEMNYAPFVWKRVAAEYYARYLEWEKRTGANPE